MPDFKTEAEGVWAPGDDHGRSEVRQNDGRVIVARAGQQAKLPYPEALWWSQDRLGPRGFAIDAQEAPAAAVQTPPAAEPPAPIQMPDPEPSPPQTPLWAEDGFIITADGFAVETP